MYQNNQVHGLTSNSTIKGVLDQWYQNNLESYASYIDTDAGFCNDRYPSTNSSSSNGSGGIGTTQTYYGAYVRLYTNKQPTFECSDEDLYTTSESSDGNRSLTYPIGLISADEVAYAGGVWGIENQNYFLYTGQVYWTMSPVFYENEYLSVAYVLKVNSNGSLFFSGIMSTGWVSYEFAVRPVINLRSDIILEGSGTADDPYVVV